MTPLTRALAGLLLAGLVALLARRARSLAPSGAVAATLVGGACVAAGWGWGALLVLFFVASTLLSRVGEEAKSARTRAIVEKGGERDALQVLANGGPFALLALLSLAFPSPWWTVAGAGALAASTADTWATEVGTLAGRRPRSLLSLKPVPPGTSGGITLPGTLGSVAGAAFIAAAALLAGWPPMAAVGALAGGIGGSLADSLLGASVQTRRWCDRCGGTTERMMHDCGTPTRHAGGLRWLDNDAVNLLASGAGAAIAVGAAVLAGGRP